MSHLAIADPQGHQFEVNLRRKLGEGGFGQVFMAQEKNEGMKCAAKQQQLDAANAPAVHQSTSQLVVRRRVGQQARAQLCRVVHQRPAYR